MIDFKQKRFQGVSSNEKTENLEVLEKYAATIRKDLEESKQNFFWLGVHLIDLYSSNSYSAIVGIRFNHEQIRNEYGFNCLLISLSVTPSKISSETSQIFESSPIQL